MSRTKEFDTDEVVEKAMHTFWQQGYHATSMTDLIAATGLNSGSIYATFKDKHALFMAALGRYSHEALVQIRKLIAEYENPREAMLALVEYSIRVSTGKDRKKSCLLGNSVLELAHCDEQVAKLARNHNQQMAHLIGEALEDAMRKKQLPRTVDAQNAAWSIICYIQGVRVLGKAGAPAQRLRPAARHFLKQLLNQKL